MKGKTKFVKDIFQNTLNEKSKLKNGSIITGVGLKSESHLGLQLLLHGDLKPGPYINCDFSILRAGNALKDFNKHIGQHIILNVDNFPNLIDKYFKKEFFVLDKLLLNCNLRFHPGDKAKVIKYNNKGENVKIKCIKKFPDDPKTHTTFGAYYIYSYGDKEFNKKDDYLE